MNLIIKDDFVRETFIIFKIFFNDENALFFRVALHF